LGELTTGIRQPKHESVSPITNSRSQNKTDGGMFKMYELPAKTKCMEVECSFWGWIKISFSLLHFNYWEDCGDRGIEITFYCPACGQEHQVDHHQVYG
jgi:hypothetical protein